jgi:hypothetical protein
MSARSSRPSDNKLWESHRMIHPDARELAISTCVDCRFLVQIQGREEVRLGCVVSIPRYGTLQQRVPEMIYAVEIIRLVGVEGLKEIVAKTYPHITACGLFQRRLSC